MGSSFGIATSMRSFWMMMRLLASTEHETAQQSSRAILTLSGACCHVEFAKPLQIQHQQSISRSMVTSTISRGASMCNRRIPGSMDFAHVQIAGFVPDCFSDMQASGMSMALGQYSGFWWLLFDMMSQLELL